MFNFLSSNIGLNGAVITTIIVIVCVIALIIFAIYYVSATSPTYSRRFFESEESCTEKIDEKRLSFKETEVLGKTIAVRYTIVTRKNKIERYVQHNYERTPIYSMPIVSESAIKEIKIPNTARALEGCYEKIPEEFSSFFLDAVIDQLDYIPEWYIREKEENLEQELSELEEKYQKWVSRYIDQSAEIKNLESKRKDLEKEYETAGSFKRKSINRTLPLIDEDILVLTNRKIEADTKRKEYQIRIEGIEKFKNRNSSENVSNSEEGFILLKDFFVNEPEEFKGCYIIKNRENDKVYVGQSKNVVKRINQHFEKGTMFPKNRIFLEDYFSTAEENRKTLFEIKTIALETKDELDATEKELIEQYDSFRNGYNATGGNY